MPICLLCQQNEATKKNSHLMPHFLIKTAINKEGSKERDSELTFGLSARDFVDTYFGRSITVDTIKQYKGRELTEEEMKDENPFSKDYIFCPICEANIGRLEEYYSENIYQKLKKRNYGTAQTDKKGNIIALYPKAKVEVLLLFVYSIFFRCSIGRYHGFRLNKDLEEKLRVILLYYLTENIQDVIDKIDKDSSEFKYYAVINTFSETDKNEDPTTNFVTIHHAQIPYFIYLNDVTFQLYEKEKHISNSIEFFYGITEMISLKESLIKSDSYPIIVFNNQQRKLILERAFQAVADRQITFLKKAFREIHISIFNSKPSEVLIQYFMHILITDELSIGERYSKENFAKAALKSLQLFYKISD